MKNMLYIIDTANVDDIRRCNEFYPIDGVTTNPTIIEGNGEAIELFATSHTLELFASSYAKVVAVVAGDNDAALAKINKDSKLDHILPGRQQRIALKASELKSGVTYTILYTSLDYAGHTSTNKYYIRKK